MNLDALYFQKGIQALSLTLIHSLWQGLIVAVLAGLILMLTKKAKPALRYNLLATLLFAFVITASYTFLNLLFAKEKVTLNNVKPTLATPTNIQNLAVIADHNSIDSDHTSAWVGYIMDFCSGNAQIIVAVWFIVFAFKSFQATAGFLYVQKIKKRNTHPLRESWKLRFDMLAKKLKISQPIQVIESEHVLVPMVIGFLKPMVIIPFGIFINLPETQIEAILLHELAHIKRRDYLVNLIQIFCENVFFFNPALLWLSGLIKEEREHCCDDLAIAVMENKTSFVHALVSFQEYNVNGSAFEMAFSKKRNHLLDRIKRIIYNNNKPLNAMEKLFVTISLVTAVALSAAVSQDVPERKSLPAIKVEKRLAALIPDASKTSAAIAQPDTLPKKKTATTVNSQVEDVEVNTNSSSNVNVDTNVSVNSNISINTDGINTYRINSNGKDYDIVQIDGKIAVLRIEGKEIPKEQFASYHTEINEVMTTVKKHQEEAEVHRKEADKHRAAADQYRAAADVQRGQADEMRVLADKQRSQADEYRKRAEQGRQEAEDGRQVAEAHAAKANVDRERFEGMQDNIIDDLKKAGVINSKTNLSYKFNENVLVVNGVKQPSALHQELKDKYMKGKNFEMLYNFQNEPGGGSSTGISIKR